MAEPITIPDLENGKIDIDTLADIVNLQEPTTETRLSGPVKTWYGLTLDLATSQGLGYPNMAALLAVTGMTEGQLAYIDAEDPDGGTYRYSGTAWEPFTGAVEKAEEVIDERIPETAVDGYAFNVIDGGNKAAFGVRQSGITKMERQEIPQVMSNGDSITTDVPAGYRFGVGDEIRWPFLIREDGAVCVGKLIANEIESDSISPIDPVTPPPMYKWESINHIFSYGQSLSMGHGGSPILTTTPPPNSFMFTGSGVRTNDSLTPYGSFSPLVESISPVNSARQETPCGGMALSIQNEIGTGPANGFQTILSADGEGGQTVAQLSKGTVNYTRLVDSVQAAKDIANGNGDTYQASAITWTQGESDYSNGTTYDTYMSRMKTLFSDFQTDAKAITGQDGDIAIFMYQIGSHLSTLGSAPAIDFNLANAHRDICVELPNAYLVTPTYHLEYKDPSNVHMPGVSYKILGGYYGYVYKKVIIDGVDWKPCDRTKIVRLGNTLNIQVHVPHGPLVIDTTLVPENTNYGFRLFNGASEISITSVSMNGPNSIKIVAATTIPAGAELRYAMDSDLGAFNGIPSGARGNFRDSQGDEVIFDPTGVNFPLHNWLVMFSQIIE